MYCTFCKKVGHHYRVCRFLKAKKEADQSSKPFVNQQQHQPSNANLVVDPDFGFIGYTGNSGMSIEQSKSYISFIIDSGSTEHLVSCLEYLDDAIDLNPPYNLGLARKDSSLTAYRKGSIQILTNLNVKGLLTNVYFAPDCRCNILSLIRLQNQNINFKVENNRAYLYTNNQILATGNRCNATLFQFQFSKIVDKTVSISNYAIMTIVNNLWHKRLGHLSFSGIQSLVENNCVMNSETMQKTIDKSPQVCEICVQSKQTRKSLNNEKVKPILSPLDRVHTDVCGPFTQTMFGEMYFLTFIEEYTHFTTVYLLKYKSEVFQHYKEYEHRMCVLFRQNGIKYLYCDNGGEYSSNEFKNYAKLKGTELHYTIRNTAALNGIAERMNRTIMDRTRALILESGLPKPFCGLAVETAVYLINRSPTNALKPKKTPFEMLTNKRPDLSNLRIFGCVSYSKTLKTDKLESHSDKCILVGYAHNGYKLFSLETEKIITVRDVIFNENLLYKDIGMNILTSKTINNCFIPDEQLQIGSRNQMNKPQNNSEESSRNVAPSLRSNSVTDVSTSNTCYKRPNNNNNLPNKTLRPTKVWCPISPHEVQTPVENTSNVNVYSQKAPNVEENYPQNESAMDENELEVWSEKLEPNINLQDKSGFSDCEDNLDLWLNDYNNMSMLLIENNEPTHFNEIANRPDQKEWMNAIISELNSLKQNNTWKLVERPKNKNVIGCKWVFKLKKDKTGEVEKYKARLVAQGFTQKFGDFSETFSPVLKLTSFRVLTSLAVQHDFAIEHLDITTAYLNSELSEEIYMEAPECIQFEGDKVCLLKRSIYGLKQAARCWQQTLNTYLLSLGFEYSKSEYCAYILDKKDLNKNLYVFVYVDDILIASRKGEDIKKS